MTESGFWVLLSLFVEETLRGAIAIDDDPADLLSRNSGSRLLGDKEGAQLLQTTLTEEFNTDKKLTKLATSVINVAARN